MDGRNAQLAPTPIQVNRSDERHALDGSMAITAFRRPATLIRKVGRWPRLRTRSPQEGPSKHRATTHRTAAECLAREKLQRDESLRSKNESLRPRIESLRRAKRPFHSQLRESLDLYFHRVSAISWRLVPARKTCNQVAPSQLTKGVER